MKRTVDAEPGLNIAGITLVLYLLVSVLSMMTLYEARNASDELRNSSAYSVPSNQSSPNKSGGDGADEFVLFAARLTESRQTGPIFEPSAVYLLRRPAAVRAFNARGPPGPAFPVA